MFFNRKSDTKNDCVIVNGDISPIGTDQVSNDEIKTALETKKRTDTDSSQDKSISVPISVQSLPDPCNYMPCYLTHTDYCSDYGLFLDYCNTGLKYSPRYLQETMLNLSFWRKKIIMSKSGLSIDLIKGILSTCSVARQHQLMQTLKRYSEYRDFHGDHRLLVLLVRAHIKRPSTKGVASKKGPVLSINEFQNYWTLSQSLCLNLDRVGIWIGLCCIGIKSSEIKRLRIQGNSLKISRRSSDISFILPEWLTKTIDLVPLGHWQHSRQNILRGISGYGTTPQKLYNSYKLYPTSGSNSSTPK